MHVGMHMCMWYMFIDVHVTSDVMCVICIPFSYTIHKATNLFDNLFKCLCKCVFPVNGLLTGMCMCIMSCVVLWM